MTIVGFLLFVVIAVLVEAIVGVIFTLPYFSSEDEKLPYIRFLIKLALAESITLSTVFLANTVMIFGYFNVVTFSYLDAALTGVLIAGGVDVVKKIYNDIVSSREDFAELKGQTEILKEIMMDAKNFDVEKEKDKK